MAITMCGRCKAIVNVDSSDIGKSANCSSCGKLFLVEAVESSESGVLTEPLTKSNEEPDTLKSILLVFGLGVGALLLIGFGILIIEYSRHNDKQKALAATQKTNDNNAAKKTNEQINLDLKKDAEMASVILSGLLFLFVICVSVGLFFFFGAWIAKDAYCRSLNGIAWAVFYFFGHLSTIVSIGGIIYFFGILYSMGERSRNEVGVMIGTYRPSVFVLIACLLSSFAASCFVLPIYLYARPKGRLTQCVKCRNKKLFALAKCPHCHHDTSHS